MALNPRMRFALSAAGRRRTRRVALRVGLVGGLNVDTSGRVSEYLYPKAMLAFVNTGGTLARPVLVASEIEKWLELKTF